MKVYIVSVDNDLEFDDFSYDDLIIAAENQEQAEIIGAQIAKDNWVNPANVSSKELIKTDNGLNIQCIII